MTRLRSAAWLLAVATVLGVTAVEQVLASSPRMTSPAIRLAVGLVANAAVRVNSQNEGQIGHEIAQGVRLETSRRSGLAASRPTVGFVRTGGALGSPIRHELIDLPPPAMQA